MHPFDVGVWKHSHFQYLRTTHPDQWTRSSHQTFNWRQSVASISLIMHKSNIFPATEQTKSDTEPAFSLYQLSKSTRHCNLLLCLFILQFTYWMFANTYPSTLLPSPPSGTLSYLLLSLVASTSFLFWSLYQSDRISSNRKAFSSKLYINPKPLSFKAARMQPGSAEF